MDNGPRNPTIIEGNLRQFFDKLLVEAAENQNVRLSPFVLDYVTELLVTFHETARLFIQKGVRVPVLADMLSDAMEADFHRRITILRQLGDTSLMVSGFFPEALSRRCMDLEYYQRMGEIAYSHLGSLSEEVNIFDELSQRFFKLSDLIHEISEQTHGKDYSFLKLIEFYMNTGSDRVFKELKKNGIIPLRRKKLII